MIGFPQRRSMSLALAFIAMSIAPCVAPAANVAAHNVSSDPAKPMARRAAAKPKPQMTDAGPLRKRLAKIPISGIAMIAPAAKARSATLSVASESARSALTRGIAAAQPPTPAPFATKAPSVARRRAQGGATILSGAKSSRASVIWFGPACMKNGGNSWRARLRLIGFRRLRAENGHSALGESARDGLWRVRFEDHALKAFGRAKGERRAGLELFVQDRCGDAAGVAQKRPFDLGVLRIKGGNARYRIERANAEERELGAQRLDIGQSPASESRADPRVNAASNQPELDLPLSQQGRSDRRIMRRHCEPKIVGKSLHRREVCRARVHEEQRVRNNESG